MKRPEKTARAPQVVVPMMLALAACKPVSTAPTYYQDVQPIIQSKCEGCHNPDGIGPFTFSTSDDAVSRAQLIKSVVSSRVMPPWPPSNSCNSYQADRSLSDGQIQTLVNWVDSGTQLGDASKQVTGKPFDGMTRVDMSLEMAEPFTPNETPDDYRCFLIPWTPTNEEFVTGFGVHPGHPQIVHHAIAYIATPANVATYRALDGTDGSPGWTCFGGPEGNSGGLGGLNAAQWLGAWAPGALGNDFPAGTGVKIEPGSALILQVHYNTTVNPPAPDQSVIDLEVADTVAKEAFVMPFVDPKWLQGNMDIPAGSPDTMYNYSIDPTPYMSILTNGVLNDSTAFTIYMSFLHMHTRGSSVTGKIVRANGANECLLDVPDWSFNWQGGYTLAQPTLFYPGDQLYLECHWNNTAANQPVIDGTQVVPHDLNWGEDTEDEMCLEVLYMTQ